MNRSDICYLISVTTENDEYGVPVKTETEVKRYCHVRSVTSSEFTAAGQQGMHPQYQIAVLQSEYDGQQLVKYNGKIYHVYRTYILSNDLIELSVEERVG